MREFECGLVSTRQDGAPGKPISWACLRASAGSWKSTVRAALCARSA